MAIAMNNRRCTILLFILYPNRFLPLSGIFPNPLHAQFLMYPGADEMWRETGKAKNPLGTLTHKRQVRPRHFYAFVFLQKSTCKRYCHNCQQSGIQRTERDWRSHTNTPHVTVKVHIPTAQISVTDERSIKLGKHCGENIFIPIL